MTASALRDISCYEYNRPLSMAPVLTRLSIPWYLMASSIMLMTAVGHYGAT